MELRKLGNTSIYLSPLTFGAWAIGKWEIGGVKPNNAIKAIQTAYNLGFTSIDTAPGYGLGLSEKVVGQAIKDLPRDRIQILTKCGVTCKGTNQQLWLRNVQYGNRIVNLFKNASKESMIRECEKSLRRLKTDYIDLYSIHWPDSVTPIEESIETLVTLMKQGKIRAGGLCNHSYEDIISANNIINIVSNKVRYSMLNKTIEPFLIPYCLKNNIGILAYSVLQRGILTGHDLPKFLWSQGDNPLEVALYEPHNMMKIKVFLNKLSLIAKDKGTTLTQLCIRWTIDQPGITVALLGASSPMQIEFDSKAMDITISKDEMETINNLIMEVNSKLEFI